MKCNVLEEEIELQVAIRTSGAARVERNAIPHYASYRSCITTTTSDGLVLIKVLVLQGGRTRRNLLLGRAEQEMKIKSSSECSL